MLYHLLYPLASEFGGFNVVRYITFRIAAATLTALFIAFLVGPPLIRALERLRVAQPIRKVGPAHQAKAGTPTMGGLLILLSLVVSVLLWSDLIIDGGAAVVENYSGTIVAGTNEQYTFTQTADLSAPGFYVIEAKTNLPGDSNTGNDTVTKTVENIILGIDDIELKDSELIVVSKPNNQFEFLLITPFDGVASIAVYNVLGQTVAFNNLSKEGDRYEYSLDMSYASAGVYIIKMGDQRSNAYKTARIIVK